MEQTCVTKEKYEIHDSSTQLFNIPSIFNGVTVFHLSYFDVGY